MHHHPFLIREKLIKFIRSHFSGQGFQEITAPVLNHGLPLEPNVHAFSAVWNTQLPAEDNQQNGQILYLSTSPENNLKKILALGAVGADESKLPSTNQVKHDNSFSQIFSIGHSFRNGEPADADHNPEFLMLEWYRSDADYRALMLDMRQLIIAAAEQMQLLIGLEPDSTICYQGKEIELESDWPVLSLDQLFKQKVGQSIQQLLPLTEIQQTAQKLGFETKHSSWEQLFNQIFISQIEPNLPDTPFFLIDYPAKTSPMCKPRQDQPHLAERFEFYLAGIELANGNTEQTDPQQTQQHFAQIRKLRSSQKVPILPVDPDFMQALEKLDQSNQTFAGVGLGIERLAMILADKKKLSSINPFTL